MEITPERTRIRIIGLVVVSALMICGWLWWRCAFDPKIFYLTGHHGADWIVYPSAPDINLHRAATWDGAFRKSFVLPDVPPNSEISVRAFTVSSLTINGAHVPLPAGSNWKSASTTNVAAWLRTGTNEIIAQVSNSNGPPALWLKLGDVVHSDPSWESSLNGAESQSAVIAGSIRPIRPGSLLYSAETTWSGVKTAWPALSVLTMGASLLWFSRKHLAGKQANATEANGDLPFWLFVAVIAVWFALIWNNARLLPVNTVGFDSVHHVNYVSYILEKGRLPFAGEGLQMFQPPLYYLICAGVLHVFGWAANSPSGLQAMRAVSLAFGLAHLFLVYRAARWIFPARAISQLLCLVVGGFMPMLLYLSFYVTNEAPMATLVAAAVVICLRILRANSFNSRWAALLGFVLGAALLTKVSAALAVMVIFVTLAGRLTAQRQAMTVWLRTCGVALLVCIAVSGWYYLLVWQKFGTPIVVGWEKAAGFAAWQEQGYRTASFFLRFGQALVHPAYCGDNSFFDGLYSTLWGDGLFSGLSAQEFLPPWNFGLAQAGYLLALIPSALIFIGVITSIRRWLRQPDAETFLLLGIAAVFLLAIALVCLTAPFVASVKAFYGLSALIPLAAFTVVGWEKVNGWNRWGGTIAGICIILVTLNGVASFWIRSNAAETKTTLALHQSLNGDSNTALAALSELTQTHPEKATLARITAMFLSDAGRGPEAQELAARAMKLAPNDPNCFTTQAAVMRRAGDSLGAVTFATRALEAGPDSLLAAQTIAASLARAGRLSDAANAARRGLSIQPGDATLQALTGTILVQAQKFPEAEVHLRYAIAFGDESTRTRMNLASALAQQGHTSDAVNQFEIILNREPNNSPAFNSLMGVLLSSGRGEDAAKHLSAALAKQPNSIELLNNLAWLRATHPDAAVRDGAEAMRLARRACELATNPEPVLFGTLAAACAEAGQFEEAVVNSRKAVTLAESANQQPMAAQQREFLALYEARKPYRDNFRTQAVPAKK